MAFDYPDEEKETEIVFKEGHIDRRTANRLVTLGSKIRQIKAHGLSEGAGTRLLIYAARLMREGVDPKNACKTAICLPLTDDESLQATLNELIEDLF